MPAQKRNFIFELGADFLRVLYLAPGPDADVRLFNALMQVRSGPDSAAVILELSKANGRILLDYGMITFKVVNSVVLDLSTVTRSGCLTEPAPEGLPYEAEGLIAEYDLFLTTPAGFKTRELYGQICFSKNITRSTG